MPKKYDYSPVIFQITLSTYKLDSLLWDIDIDKKKKCRKKKMSLILLAKKKKKKKRVGG